MHIEIDRQADPVLLDELAAALTRVLAEVRLAVEDWRAMRRACLDAIADLGVSHSMFRVLYARVMKKLGRCKRPCVAQV